MNLKNVAASVRARLTHHARATQRPFQEVLQYYGLERFLYRLGQSEHRDRFVLKGALLMNLCGAPFSRPTRDIDLLGRVDNSVENLEGIIRTVCSIEVTDDGMMFDPYTVVGKRIKEDADYEGVRIVFTGFLERAKVPMQIDIGFGDIVHPTVSETHYPSLLEFPSPKLYVYPRESVVAEKYWSRRNTKLRFTSVP